MITSEKVPLVCIKLYIIIRVLYIRLTRVFCWACLTTAPPTNTTSSKQIWPLQSGTTVPGNSSAVRLLRNRGYICLFCVIRHIDRFIATKTAVRYSACDAFMNIRPFLVL